MLKTKHNSFFNVEFINKSIPFPFQKIYIYTISTLEFKLEEVFKLIDYNKI